MKPILFNTEMVRAILAGRKTQTRRVLKDPMSRAPCEPGDILYVRETWKIQSARRFDADVRIMFRAGGPMSTINLPGARSWAADRDEYDAFVARWQQSDGWHPSIHMPKEAARIFLRVTDVRVERLRDITEEDAVREGFYKGWRRNGQGSLALSARQAFMWLWTTITKDAPAAESWPCNPWVWVIEFERCENPEDSGAKEDSI